MIKVCTYTRLLPLSRRISNRLCDALGERQRIRVKGEARKSNEDRSRNLNHAEEKERENCKLIDDDGKSVND